LEHVTISIEGTAEEVQIALRRLAALAQMATAEPSNVSWFGGEIANFFNSLQSNAQKILVEIARRYDGYNRDELLSALSFKPRELAGSLSSVGHTLRRFYPMKPRPVSLDHDSWQYRMLPEVARWILANMATSAESPSKEDSGHKQPA
jgi:hypothetical protein